LIVLDRHLTPDDRISDLLDHPAFSGFARLILPRDDRGYDQRLRLRDLGSLMPYHSHVVPSVIVGALNRLIDDARTGKTVFYDIYTDAAKQADPTKRATGLFFFRGKPDAPFALIAPGGGFEYVASIHEGFPYAMQIAEHGYNAFVVKYRVQRGGEVATEDMAAALTYIERRAAELHVGREHYSLWGSSAGARMAASIGSHGASSFGGAKLPKPSAVIMAYTGHAEHGANEPPTFVAVGARDGIAPPSTMKRRLAALRAQGTDVEFHEFPHLVHGFGAGTGTSADGWISSAFRFWERQIGSAR
jgi:acetyl esterase/lipase